MTAWILSIDFGTSYTVAAAKVDGRAPEIVEIQGERRAPSVVLVLPNGEIVVGRAAEDFAVSHPGNALRRLKSRLGDSAPVIVGGRPYQVVHLVAALLREVVRQVTEQMGHPPREVRLTHPASWNTPRQNRLLEAAAKAGIDHAVLVPEPVAAAVSYAADVGLDAGRFIAVYDLGGGTFDCAVLRGGEFAVVGQTAGDQNIGGELFDELLMNRIGQQLDPKVWDAIQVGEQTVWLQVGAALRNEARKAKEALSSNSYVDVIVALPAGLVQVRLTRSDFEAIARPYLVETISLMERCIVEAGLSRRDLSAISLVGGASRSPLVEVLMAAAFPDVTISRRGDPKASVAIGAALATRPAVNAARPAIGAALGGGGIVTQPASPGTAVQPVRLAPPTVPPTASPTGLTGPATGPLTERVTGTPPFQHVPPSPTRVASSPPPEPDSLGPHRPASIAKSRRRLIAALGGALAVLAVVAVAVAVNRDAGTPARQTAETSPEDSTPATGDSASSSTDGAAGAATPAPSVPALSATTSPQSTEPAEPEATTSTDLDLGPLPGDASVGTVVLTLTGHSALVSAAAFSPDGQKLATGGTDYTAKIWDLTTGTVIWNLTTHTLNVVSVAFDRTGTRLVTASDDGTARVWDVATGAELAVLRHDAAATYFSVNAAEFNGDGTRIITASDDSTARLWDAATGAELYSLSHDSFVRTAVFSPDGATVVTASLDGTAKIWAVATGELLVTLEGHTQGVESASFSPDGTKIVTASEDNTAKIWDTATGALLATLFGHVRTVEGASFSHDGTRIVTASEDSTAKLWDATTAELLLSLAHDTAVGSAVFSPDDTEIVTLDGEYTGHLWNSAEGTPLVELPKIVYTVVFSPDGNLLATGAFGGGASVLIWSAAVP